ncbi:MAG: hypothetical protein R3220_04895 [Balneolaceae bacterium]|nr:hypothetical protein [Balneolaceae bacterium]
MLSPSLLTFIFIAGAVVFGMAIYGVYSHFLEMRSEFDKKKESFLSYRTKEEFVGESSSKE